MGGAFSLLVYMLTSPLEYQAPAPMSSFLSKYTLGGSSDGVSNQVPASHVRDVD